MVKIYFDWNVMAQMKNGFHKELKEIAFNNNKFFKPYSTSHISDIFSSFKEDVRQTELINADLEFISKFTNDTFLFNTGKEIIIDFADPKEYYKQLVEEKDHFKDLSIDNLFKHFEDDNTSLNLVKPLLNSLKEIRLDYLLKEAFENPEGAKQIETMFPGLMENPTMDGFFKSFSQMLRGLNEDERYKDFRKVVQSGLGINRDKIFDNKAPYDIIDARYKQIGQNRYQNIDNDKSAPKWFNEIANEYLHLDMHGYQEDNVTISKGRKETFKNTTEDAFHAAFASTCNFYVINDKKSYKKAKQVFEKLQINTLVLRPDEFLKYYKDYLHLEEPILNINIAFALFKNENYREDQLENAILRTYHTPFFLFSFFNKVMILLPSNEEPVTVILRRDKPTNGTVYIMEITRLAHEISSICGEDIQSLGEVKDEEFTQDNWIGRNWILDDLKLKLVCLNGYFQLYIE